MLGPPRQTLASPPIANVIPLQVCLSFHLFLCFQKRDYGAFLPCFSPLVRLVSVLRCGGLPPRFRKELKSWCWGSDPDHVKSSAGMPSAPPLLHFHFSKCALHFLPRRPFAQLHQPLLWTKTPMETCCGLLFPIPRLLLFPWFNLFSCGFSLFHTLWFLVSCGFPGFHNFSCRS